MNAYPLVFHKSHNFDIVNSRDPQTGIRIGQIYAYRNYDESDEKMLGVGISGHTSIVTNVTSNKIVTIENCRDMPTIEGYIMRETAISDIVNNENRGKKNMFFSKK